MLPPRDDQRLRTCNAYRAPHPTSGACRYRRGHLRESRRVAARRACAVSARCRSIWYHSTPTRPPNERAERLGVAVAEDGERVVRHVGRRARRRALHEEGDARGRVEGRARSAPEAPDGEGLRVRRVLRLARVGERELALAEEHQPAESPRTRAARAARGAAAPRAGTDPRSRACRASTRGRAPCAGAAAAALRPAPRGSRRRGLGDLALGRASSRCRCARRAGSVSAPAGGRRVLRARRGRTARPLTTPQRATRSTHDDGSTSPRGRDRRRATRIGSRTFPLAAYCGFSLSLGSGQRGAPTSACSTTSTRSSTRSIGPTWPHQPSGRRRPRDAGAEGQAVRGPAERVRRANASPPRNPSRTWGPVARAQTPVQPSAVATLQTRSTMDGSRTTIHWKAGACAPPRASTTPRRDPPTCRRVSRL